MLVPIFYIKKCGEPKGSPRRGAGDRGRTDTVSLPLDFESSASANSTTPAKKFAIFSDSFDIISHRGAKCKSFL